MLLNLSLFEILSCFKTLPRRPEILCGGLNEILRREISRGNFIFQIL